MLLPVFTSIWNYTTASWQASRSNVSTPREQHGPLRALQREAIGGRGLVMTYHPSWIDPCIVKCISTYILLPKTSTIINHMWCRFRWDLGWLWICVGESWDSYFVFYQQIRSCFDKYQDWKVLAPVLLLGPTLSKRVGSAGEQRTTEAVKRLSPELE